ncbi:MAG: hypothetical protein ACWA44_14225 [Thiotrichales bacterium]
MNNVKNIVLFPLAVAMVGTAHAESDDQILLNSFHEYGITKCDKFILENSSLQGNWNFFINKHAGDVDGSATEVSVVRVWGSENDTVKVDDSYIQTPKNCYLHSRHTITFSGPCESNIDGNVWYVANPMPGRDYIQYKNKHGVEMLAKEIQVGNFKACVQEGAKRLKGNQG